MLKQYLNPLNEIEFNFNMMHLSNNNCMKAMRSKRRGAKCKEYTLQPSTLVLAEGCVPLCFFCNLPGTIIAWRKRIFRGTLSIFCKSKRCIIFNVYYLPGSKKSKFGMTLIIHSPFKTCKWCSQIPQGERDHRLDMEKRDSAEF